MGRMKYSLQYIILEYLFLMGLFSGYVGHMKIWRVMLITLSLLLLVIDQKFQRGVFKSFSLFSLLLVLWVFIGINYVITNPKTYASTNVELLFWGLLSVVPLVIISTDNNNIMGEFLYRKFWVINIWLGLNLIIVAIQTTGYPLFIKAEWLSTNPFYADLCCGLFGGARTNALALFSCFAVIYNLVYVKRLNGINKTLEMLWIVISVLMILWTSARNDNLSVFFLLPISCAVYYFLYEKKKIHFTKRIKKIIRVVVLLIIGGLLAYQIPAVKEIVDVTIKERFVRFIYYNQLGGAYGSNERLAIFFYAMENSWGWKIGRGIGVSPWRKTNAFGFRHYGLSSIGTVTNLLGIWAYLLITLIYTHIGVKVSRVQNKERMLYAIILFVLTIIVSVYTELYTTDVFSYWYILWFSVFSLKIPSISNDSLEREE